ncbi:radical SAM protein [Marinithermofilum abyssi]|uniref:Radical SAM protein n=1 Tax=Marinithermofilum abyssi TaxID=1571185 RepID=A0A8J2YAV0_9BACL|nr:radical SAM protein [Marinithermofilum abyssi]GGE20170.1 radical SAM protein [Marinithermofilum abyssi]
MQGELPSRWFPAKPKSVLNRVREPAMSFDWSINPYRGCGHGCHFCYARGTHAWLGFHADDSFKNNIYVKRDAAEVLRQELKRGKWKGGHIAVGTATDPYQQLEGKLQITRSIIEVLAEYQVPFSITTRSPLVLRDVDVLKVANIQAVNVSLSTLDEEVWCRTEPASPHPRQRLRTVEELNKAGIRAGLFLAPIIPYLTDAEEQLRAYMEAAKKHGAYYVVPSILRLKPEVKGWFFRQIQPYFPRVYPHLVRLYQEGARVGQEYQSSLMERVAQQMEAAGFSGGKAAMYRMDEESGKKEQAEEHGEFYEQLTLF